MLLFATEKQVKRVFRAFIPKSVKEFRKRENLHTLFSCTFGAKSTKSLRTTFSAGACDPRRCTGRARSSLCATPWRTRRSPHPLFPRQTRVRIDCAANGGIIIQCALEARINLLVLPASGCVSLLFRKTNHPRNSIFSFSARRFPTWFRWRKSGRRAESDSGGDGLLANPRSRPTPLSAFRTPASESVGWLLLLFAIEKQRKKKKFSHVLLGPKVPKASARRFPRDCANRGAARGAQDQAYAPPRGGRAAARTLFFPRQTRVRIDCAANGGIDYLYMAMRSGILFTRKAIPDLVPMAEKRPEG